MKKNKETTMTEETETIIDLTPGKPIETEAQETTDVVKQETHEVTRPATTPLLSNLGDMSSRIKIAYSVSANMPDDAIEGSLVISNDQLGWSTILPASSKETLKVLILSAKVYYKEYLTSEQFMSGARARVYATKEDAIRDGQTTEWGPTRDDRPSVAMAIDLHMLVKKNDIVSGADSKFFLCIDGEEYAPCVMTIEKAAVKTVYPFLRNLTMIDAATRKVHISRARPDAYFCALKVNAIPMASNPARKSRIPSFAVMTDEKHTKVSPSESFREQLKAFADMFKAAPEPSEDDDGLPF